MDIEIPSYAEIESIICDYYPEIQNFDNEEKINTPFHFDIGFLTNRVSFSENFWLGFHFQRPFVSFFWKI